MTELFGDAMGSAWRDRQHEFFMEFLKRCEDGKPVRVYVNKSRRPDLVHEISMRLFISEQMKQLNGRLIPLCNECDEFPFELEQDGIKTLVCEHFAGSK